MGKNLIFFCMKRLKSPQNCVNSILFRPQASKIPKMGQILILLACNVQNLQNGKILIVLACNVQNLQNGTNPHPFGLKRPKTAETGQFLILLACNFQNPQNGTNPYPFRLKLPKSTKWDKSLFFCHETFKIPPKLCKSLLFRPQASKIPKMGQILILLACNVQNLQNGKNLIVLAFN